MEWQQSKLTNISQVRTGKWDANHATEDGAYKFFTCAYEALLCDTKRFDGECLILPGNGANVGEVFYYSGEFDAYQRTYVVSDIKVLPKFLFYHMKCFWRERNLYKQHGAATNYLKIGNFHEYEVSYPDTPEQKRIVAILDEVFADIEQVRAKTEQNLKNARELFESYLQQVFSQRGKGWVEYKMSEVCTITSKLIDPKDSEYLDLPHVGAGNMVSGSGELVDVKTAREEGLISGKFPFDSTMVLYSKIRPYLMKVCRPDFSGLCSADVYPLVPIDGLLDKDYLFYLLLSQDFTEYAVSGSGRAGMPKVNRTHLFNYLLSVPSIESQREYVVKMDQILEYSQTLESVYSLKLKSLDELKKSILQKAFSGELTQKNNQGAVA